MQKRLLESKQSTAKIPKIWRFF